MSSSKLSTSPRRQARRRAVVWPIVGLIALGGCGLVLLGIATTRVGGLGVAVGALAALLPVIPVVAAFLWIDRWEPEPPPLLVSAFLWGACGATVSALAINDTASVIGQLLIGNSTVPGSLVGAPLVEETGKGLFVFALLLWRRSEFNGIVDGIVYSGMTAAGFAFTENIFYFGQAFSQAGFGNVGGGVIAVFLLRGVLAPFSHPLFSAMFGIGLGVAVTTGRRWLRVFAPTVGYLASVALHAVWNGVAVLGGGSAFINVYFVIMVPLFACTVALVVWQRRREQRMVTDQLPRLVRAGLIVPSEVDLLASLPARRGWRRKARQAEGRETERAVRDYQLAVTELAFLQYRADHGRTADSWRRARRQELVDKLKDARRAATGSTDAIHTSRIQMDQLTQTDLRKPRDHGH